MLGVWSPRQMPYSGRPSASAVGFVLVLMHLALTNGLSYFCLFPQNIRPGSDFDLSVTLYERGITTLKVAIIEEKSGSMLVTKTETVDVPVTGKRNTLIKLPIPAISLESSYKVEISGTGRVRFSNSTTVAVIPKSLSILVQTDKALYKPGQKVLFRVVAVYPSMKPYKGVMDVAIYDKDRNRIAQWLQVKSNQGVFSNELSLSSLTPLGKWQIEVSTKVETTSGYFEVAEYVLPKFEVNVILPSFYILYIDKPALQPSLYVTVTARYTYGQPVKGIVKLTANVVTFWIGNKQIPWTKTVILVNGSASVEITPAELSQIVPHWLKENLFNGTVPAWTQLEGQTIIVTADVTEKGTQVTLSSNNTVTCYTEKYDLSFMDITPDSFKPGLNFTGYLELKQKDGSPPLLKDIIQPNGRFREINITVTTVMFRWPWFPFRRDFCSMEQLQKNVPLTPSGHVQFDFEIKANCSVRIEASFLDTSTNKMRTAIKTISPFESKAMLGIQVTLENEVSAIKPGDVAKFKVRTTVPAQTLYYVVMSKGTIHISEMISNVNGNSHTINLNVNKELAQKLSPSARLVVWCVVDKLEIISDAIEFNVEGTFANNVSIKFNKETVEPGKNVSVSVYGSRGSSAYVLVVDQSVLLLKRGNDITQKMVLDDLKTYEGPGGFKLSPFCCIWPFPSGGKDSEEVFKSALLQYLTDGYVHTAKVFPRDEFFFDKRDGVAVQSFIPLSDGSPGKSSPSSPAIALRQVFPETWIFKDTIIGDPGYGNIEAKAPDTMTSWIATAFAVNDKDGLGIAPSPANLTVFRPFFVSMTLPYSINRGEELTLKVTVFNYFNRKLKVQVLLKASSLFSIRIGSEFVPNTNFTKDIEVEKNDAVTLNILIKAEKVGQIPIEVWANAGMAGDAERRTLLVVPEGIPQQYSTSVLIDHSKGIDQSKTSFNVTLPTENLVPDSEHLQVTAIGDFLGSTLNGLDRLIQMPYGCGEQTMLTLAPNIFILKYLRTTGTLTSDIEKKCKNYIMEGYQRELTFQRYDGSFSAFGNNDQSGSIWLSAFVVLVFPQAKNDIPVEDAKIALTLNWIIELQSPNGSFSEPPLAIIYHTDMQGGSSKGVSLTAYVLIALLENQNNTVVNKALLKRSISKALVYLEQQLNSINDSYSLCIVSYALVLAGSSKASLALSKRDALAIVESSGLKHWEKIEPLVATNTGSYIPPYQQAAAINIEMTAYALLTYVQKKDANGAVPVAKWLIAQRNPNGGFVSTQDTVMAIRALASFAALIYGPRNSFNLNVNARIGLENHAFEPITPRNMLTLQIWEPTKTTGIVHVNANGQGVALVQVNVMYNVYKMDESRGFSLTIETTAKENGAIVVVKTCARWTRKDRECGMALETVQLLSGYEFVSVEEVSNSRGLLKKIENDLTSVNIYYDKLDDVAVCIAVTMRREYLVGNMKKATIKVFEYYNPENYIIGTYGLS